MINYVLDTVSNFKPQKTYIVVGYKREIVENITKEVDKIYPRSSKFFDSSTDAEQKTFYKKLNDVLFEGDLSKELNPGAIDDLVKFLQNRAVRYTDFIQPEDA